jgi:hypothetical protein
VRYSGLLKRLCSEAKRGETVVGGLEAALQRNDWHHASKMAISSGYRAPRSAGAGPRAEARFLSLRDAQRQGANSVRQVRIIKRLLLQVLSGNGVGPLRHGLLCAVAGQGSLGPKRPEAPIMHGSNALNDCDNSIRHAPTPSLPAPATLMYALLAARSQTCALASHLCV